MSYLKINGQVEYYTADEFDAQMSREAQATETDDDSDTVSVPLTDAEVTDWLSRVRG